MKNLKILFVKCRPPREIAEGRTPVKENNRYNWEPLVLKYLAWQVRPSLGPGDSCVIWHSISAEDGERLLTYIEREKPQIIMFTDLDILVNRINEVSGQIRRLSPSSRIVVGGKQSSLLRQGDRLPFTHADCVITGDGSRIVPEIIARVRKGIPLDGIGIETAGDTVISANSYSRTAALSIDPRYRALPVINRTTEEYIETYQSFGCIEPGPVRTAPLIMGTGCPYRCVFCQSPMEYGADGNGTLLRAVPELTDEILYLRERFGVNNIFSLESNLDLPHLGEVYRSLERRGVSRLAVSGFIRVTDVIPAHGSGLLGWLVKKGMRVLSVGIDIPVDSKQDRYQKSYSYKQMTEALELCREYGILLLATYVGSPDLSAGELRTQLEALGALPLADIDIRLAIALRNTQYFHQVKEHLIFHPDRDPAYFDRQNYRYQTIRIPGKITPEQTYRIVGDFVKRFLFTPSHISFVREMLEAHPDTAPFFMRQYGVGSPEALASRLKGGV